MKEATHNQRDPDETMSPGNGQVGRSLDQGKIPEAVSFLNEVTHYVTADIAPDVSQLIMELPQ